MSNMETLKNHDFKFNKAYGQNFIFDKNFLKSIVINLTDNITEVLEIGAGAGTLTAMLCEHSKKVVSYEIDKNLQPILQENLNKYQNLEIIFQDIMKVNLDEIENHFENNYIMIANIPYYITTPIIFKFLESKKIKSMSIMIQQEVADRLTAKAGTKDYGAITVAIDARANAKTIKKVGRHMFTPVPNVDSAIVKIDLIPNKYEIINESILDDTIKCAFGNRRKTLYNNIKSYFNFNSEQANSILEKANIKPEIRGEKLTTEEFVNLSNIIAEYKK